MTSAGSLSYCVLCSELVITTTILKLTNIFTHPQKLGQSISALAHTQLATSQKCNIYYGPNYFQLNMNNPNQLKVSIKYSR